MNIEENTRRAITLKTRPYCHLTDEDSFIEVTQWSNGEGYDVHISNKGSDQTFSITDGEFEALTVAIRYRS